MTLRQIMDATVITEAAQDRRLTASDFRAFVHLYYSTPATIYAHAQKSNIARETLRRSVKRLVSYGWALAQSDDKYPLISTWMPIDVEKRISDELARSRNEVNHLGEWLMKCLLDLIVADRDFRDNVRPEWLVRGDGGKRLELDRWYPKASVAFEFQGQQHFRIGSDFSTTSAELNEQISRDNVKFGLCTRRGIRLIEVTAGDLTIENLRSRVESLMPIAPTRSKGPLIETLEGLCRAYRNYIARSVNNHT